MTVAVLKENHIARCAFTLDISMSLLLLTAALIDKPPLCRRPTVTRWSFLQQGESYELCSSMTDQPTSYCQGSDAVTY